MNFPSRRNLSGRFRLAKLRQLFTRLLTAKTVGHDRSFRNSWLVFPLLTLLTLFLTLAPSFATLENPVPPLSRSTPDGIPLSVAQSAPIAQGKAHYDAGRFTDAAEVWQAAAQLYQSQGDSLNQALSLSYWALAQQELGHLQGAQQAITTSLNLLSTPPRTQPRDQTLAVLAQTLNTQGGLQLALGQIEAALETWKTAEQTYAQLHDTSGIWGSQLNQVQALQALGLFRRATTLLEQLNQQLQSTEDSALKAIVLRSLGNLWQVSGNGEAAQTTLERSLTIAQQLHLPTEISATLFSLANLNRSHPDLALDYYQQAARTALTPLTRLQSQVNQLSLLLDQQRWTEAQSLAIQIQPQLNTLPPSQPGIYAQVNYAASLMKQSGNAQSSLSFSTATLHALLSTAVDNARILQDARAESYALGQLGALYEQNHQWQEAQSMTQQALFVAQSIDAPYIAYRWQWQLGRLYKQQGDRSAAVAAYTEAVSLLKSLRADLVSVSPDIQFSFREKVEPVYRELVDLLIQGDSIASYSRSIDRVSHEIPDLVSDSTSDLAPSQTDLKQAREIIESLQLAELQNFFRSACLDAHPSQIDQVDPTTAVFYPIILPDRLAVILSIPGHSLITYSTAIPQDQVETLANQALESLTPIFADSERLSRSQQLYDWLIRPAELPLANHPVKTLVFVLDGVLRNIPLAALYDGQHYLLERYSIAVAPGLQLLEPRSLTPEQRLEVLIGGISEARQGFTALPGVAEESNQIATKLTADVLLNQNFTQTNLEKQIQSSVFPLVHLATHGQFSSKLDDTFILTWDDRLTIEGLRNLLRSRSEPGTAPIELIVLSACETAEGDQRATLGLAGLAVRSGARSTVATLWAVNDESTAALMVQFYQILTQQNLSKADSLRQAQLALLHSEQFQHPYYWAPFILVGNWL